MINLIRFLGVLISIFLFSHFNHSLLSQELAVEDSINLDSELDEFPLEEDEEWISLSELDSSEYGLYLNEYLSQGLFNNDDDIIDFIIGAPGPGISYILYARPRGALGKQLDNFWSAVKEAHLNDLPVLTYPPHISLTGFFSQTKNGQPVNEEDLIDALQAAVKATQTPISIQIANNITKKDSIDSIPIKSPALHKLTTKFMKKAKVSDDFIKPLTYHITLRQYTNDATTQKVRKLENKYINLKEPNLQSHTGWVLFIYKKVDGKLEIVYQQSIKTS